MQTPLLSCVLPCFNAEATLERALRSLSEDPVDFPAEILFVDNASTDGSADIARKLAVADNRIRILHEPVKGIAYALNRGLAEARGRYIARMDADDFSLPGRLQKQVNYLEQHPHIGLVSGLVEFEGNVSDALGYAEYVRQLNTWQTEEELYRYRFVESPFAHPSVLFRRELIDRYGPYTINDEPEDYELWLRWFAAGVRMAKLPEPVLRWYDSPGRLSRSHVHYAAEAFDRVRYRYLADWLRQKRADLPPLYVWGGGKLATRKMKVLETLTGIPVRGIIDIKEKAGHLHFSNLPPAGEIFVLSLVSNRGKYLEIENYLRERGYVAERDYVLAQ